MPFPDLQAPARGHVRRASASVALAAFVALTAAGSILAAPVPAEASGVMVTSTVQDHLLGKAVLVAHHGR